MRVTKPRLNTQADWERIEATYRICDWKDVAGLIDNIDNELKDFGLELVMADFGSDDYLVRVERRGHARKKETPSNKRSSKTRFLRRRKVQRAPRTKSNGSLSL